MPPYLTAWMHLSSSLLESSQLISHLINVLLCLAKMEFASNCYTRKMYAVVIGSEWSTVFVLQAFPVKKNIYNTTFSIIWNTYCIYEQFQRSYCCIVSIIKLKFRLTSNNVILMFVNFLAHDTAIQLVAVNVTFCWIKYHYYYYYYA